MKTTTSFRLLAFTGAVALAGLSSAHAQVLLSDTVVVNTSLQGSYSDQAALNRGNSGAFLADTNGNFVNGTGLLSPDVDGSMSTAGALPLQLGMNTFYVLVGNTGETTSSVNLFFNGANPDTTTAGITGEAATNGTGFTPYDPVLDSYTTDYTTPGGLTTIIGNQSITLTNLQISTMGLGPFPAGTSVGYSSATGTDYTADVALVTLDVESVVPAGVPEPSTWALLGLGVGLLGVVTLRRRRTA